MHFIKQPALASRLLPGLMINRDFIPVPVDQSVTTVSKYSGIEKAKMQEIQLM